MSDAPAKPISDTKGKDKDTLVSIVNEMTESMTGAQSTRHWAEDALWFDIPPFASRGIQPALKFFDRVFGGFRRRRREPQVLPGYRNFALVREAPARA